MNQRLSPHMVGCLQVVLTLLGGGLLLCNILALFLGGGLYALLALGLTVWYMASIHTQRWVRAATSGMLAAAVTWWTIALAQWFGAGMHLPFF